MTNLMLSILLFLGSKTAVQDYTCYAQSDFMNEQQWKLQAIEGHLIGRNMLLTTTYLDGDTKVTVLSAGNPRSFPNNFQWYTILRTTFAKPKEKTRTYTRVYEQSDIDVVATDCFELTTK